LSNESSCALSCFEQDPNSSSLWSLQPLQALQPPRISQPKRFCKWSIPCNTTEDDWEPDLESEDEPPSDDESRGQIDGAGSSRVAPRMRKTGKRKAKCLGPQGPQTRGYLKFMPQATRTRFAKRVRKQMNHIWTLAGRSRIANGMPTKS